MLKEMQLNDVILFYHSSTQPPGIAGLAKVSQLAQPDPSAFDKKSAFYDETSSKEKPRWFCVEVSFVKKFKNFISLDELRSIKGLEDMLVLKKGQRLSIQPVLKREYDIIQKKAD